MLKMRFSVPKLKIFGEKSSYDRNSLLDVILEFNQKTKKNVSSFVFSFLLCWTDLPIFSDQEFVLENVVNVNAELLHEALIQSQHLKHISSFSEYL